ncbi:peptidase S41 [Aliikangiella marina]|uniref:Tricorn protease homolog n=2 Tax=Aliikangiella marina TaxID=1712262 RepID=A0A545TEJ6_9GAMM|nr:peptidase S41 [Aliikangiella marina]
MHFSLLKALWIVCLSLVFYSGSSNASTQLLSQPSISEKHLVFVFGGDIWVAQRDGNNPRRLTSHPATELAPKISPDGKTVAFTAYYDRNPDVYLVSIDGGQPKRLTFHPDADMVNGWTPDGQSVVFTSSREILNSRSRQLYEISIAGGYPRKIMEAIAYEGTWNSSATEVAYRPFHTAHGGASGWHLHRGGTTPPIWIINPKTGKTEKLPHNRSNDTNPMWRDNMVYFISDRDNVAANLYAYNRKTQLVSRLTEEVDWNIRSAAIYNNTIVYEVGGILKRLDLDSGQSTNIEVNLTSDSVQLRPQWKNTSGNIERFELSKSGKRAVITARGDIYTVPLEDGSIRNITATDGVRESNGVWSSNGKKIAFISEAFSKKNIVEHQLIIADQTGLGTRQTIDLKSEHYLTLLSWSPDDSHIIFQDNHLRLFGVNLKSKRVFRIDTDQRRAGLDFSFSSDSRWLAYTVSGENYFSQIKLYDFKRNKKYLITDRMSHAHSPVFAKDDYLYFAASTNTGPSQVGLDMSTQERPVRSAIYVAVLAKDGKSPLIPKTGDEETSKTGEDKKSEEEEEAQAIQIDLTGILNRVEALPLPERNYDSLSVADDGALFFVERIQPGVSNELPGSERFATADLKRFDFEKKEAAVVMSDVGTYVMSADGKKLLIMTKGNKLVHGDAKDKLETKSLDTAGMRAFVEPKQEWLQIFNETWWMQKEYFYDPGMHGSDWMAVYKKYRPLLEHVSRREDLNELMVEMIGELEVGHNRVWGGDVHRETAASIGLLGADFAIKNNRYQIVKIYTGERWNPFLKAPLSIPGIGVKEGDYILAINGRTLTAQDNIFSFLEGTNGQQISLTVNAKASSKGAKTIVVEPIDNERMLRHWYWVEKNRRYVEEKTDGKVAYVYLPNTAGAGYTYFNRMFFAQVDKRAVIIDERRNSGGQAANYITDVLSRQYLAGWKDRDGLVFSTPGGAIYGPKVMLIDQDAGSGGDFLPYSFKRMGLGKLIGKRTWGGLIGISANPRLIDGGGLVVPFFRFFTPDSEWRVENEGVAPDIEVDLEPSQVNQGVDTQLDRAIKEVLEQLKSYQPVRLDEAPPMPKELGK